MVQKQPRSRSVTATYSLHSGEFDAGPRDYTHDLGYTVCIRVRAHGHRLRRPDNHDHAGAAGGLWNSNVLPVYVDGLTATP